MAKDKGSSKGWKHGRFIPMVKRFCSVAAAMVWANPSKQGMYRCTKCGAEHS
jgi:hypothetical protein